MIGPDWIVRGDGYGDLELDARGKPQSFRATRENLAAVAGVQWTTGTDFWLLIPMYVEPAVHVRITAVDDEEEGWVRVRFVEIPT